MNGENDVSPKTEESQDTQEPSRNYNSPNPSGFNFYFCVAAVFDIIDTCLPGSGIALDAIAAVLIGRWVTKNGGLVFGGGGKGGAAKTATTGGSKMDTVKSAIASGPFKLIVMYLIEQIPGLSMILPTWTLSVISTSENKSRYFIVFGTLFLSIPIVFLYLLKLLFPDPCAVPANTQCGFDETKITKYEDPNSGSIVSFAALLTDNAKKDAIERLGISETDIKPMSEQEIADLIRAEVAKQWAKVPEADRHGSTQLDAERGILVYAIGENEGLGHFVEKGRLYPWCESNNASGGVCENDNRVYTNISSCDGIAGTFQPLSVTCGKYNYTYNQQLGVAWDIKYDIFLGVRENINDFVTRAGGEGWERWQNNWNVVFGGTWWVTGDRLQNAINKANQYAVQEYKCQTGGNLSGDHFPVEGYAGSIPPSCVAQEGATPDFSICDGGGISFGGDRTSKGRYHAGIDLLMPEGTPVKAIKDGKVVAIMPFCTYCSAVNYLLLVDHGDYVANYGEVIPEVSIGQEVKSGQRIATVSGVGMCHFELYKPGTTTNYRWYVGQPKPDQLLDPTEFLKSLLGK